MTPALRGLHAGEAIELVNLGGAAADLGGWTLSDSLQVRHTFAAGTTLEPGKAIVVFGGASAIPSGLTNAVASSTGSLGLNNSSDTVRFADAANGTKDYRRSRSHAPAIPDPAGGAPAKVCGRPR